VNDDEKWRLLLRGLNKTFYHQTVTTQEIENYISEFLGLDLTAFFDQYLRDVRIPNFEYYIDDNELSYRWNNVVKNFEMPIEIEVNKENYWLYPNSDWQKMEINTSEIRIDRNYYIEYKKLK
jgi:aminopeptidase N